MLKSLTYEQNCWYKRLLIGNSMHNGLLKRKRFRFVVGGGGGGGGGVGGGGKGGEGGGFL